MECKSCGAYYKGKVCPKCGYGKKPSASKAAARYKKARKPERFRTAEDNKLYAQWEAEEKTERVKDPAAAKKFLIVVAVVVVGMVFAALYQSGAIFSNTRTEVVEQYFDSLRETDYDKYVKCFPREIRSDIDLDRDEAGLSKKEYMLEVYNGLSEIYGEGYGIGEPVFGREKELTSAEYDMSGYQTAHGSAPRLKEVYEMVVDVNFAGTKSQETVRLYFYVGKQGGYWRIFGMDEDTGIITEEDLTAQQEPLS